MSSIFTFKKVEKKKTEKGLCPQCGEERMIAPSRKVCQGCRTFNRRVKIGEVLEPSYNQVNTASYKEPMRKVEEGFGYYGAITSSNDGGHIQCHVCGYFFANLGAHVSMKHSDLGTQNYKVKFGLRLKEGLLSDVERVSRQDSYNKTARENLQNLEKAWAANKKKRESGELKSGGDMWSPQTRNEKGMCEDQTIAKLQHLAEANGGVVTQKLFLAEYGGGALDPVRTWFGTWENALEKADIKSFIKSRKEVRDNIPQSILDFYIREGRTPQSSDFDSDTLLPGRKIVSNSYGNLNNARQAAGVPRLILVDREWVEVM